jgi:hypothetical protein
MKATTIAFLANVLGCDSSKEAINDSLAKLGFDGFVTHLQGVQAGTESVAVALKPSQKEATKNILKKLKGINGKDFILVDKSDSRQAIQDHLAASADETFLIKDSWDSFFAAKSGGDDDSDSSNGINAGSYKSRVAIKGEITEQEEEQETVRIKKIEIKASDKIRKAASGKTYADVTYTMKVPSLGVRRFSDNTTMLAIHLADENHTISKALKAIGMYDKMVAACKEAADGNPLDETLSAKLAGDGAYQVATFQQNIADSTIYKISNPAEAQVAFEEVKDVPNAKASQGLNGMPNVYLYHEQSGLTFRGLQDDGDKDSWDESMRAASAKKDLRAKREELAFQAKLDRESSTHEASLIGTKIKSAVGAIQELNIEGVDLNHIIGNMISIS